MPAIQTLFSLRRLALLVTVLSMLLCTHLAHAQLNPLETGGRGAAAGGMQLKSGVVANNVFVSLSQAGVPDDVALTLLRELSQAVNLNDGLKPDDRFAVLYEKPLLGTAGKNKLLAFEYTQDIAVYSAYWFEQGALKGFYQEDGSSLRASFLRTPVDIVRVSSSFGMRQHPLRKAWLTHEGTDFAAPTGTKVFASGDGEVAYIGTQSGFGKVIKLKHPQDTQTVYAHLSAFSPSLKMGSTVKQGEVIGEVGATGWATGPHLHYEYRVGNKPIDPFNANIPTVNRISPALADAFVSQLMRLRSHFALVRKPSAAVEDIPTIRNE